MKCCAHEWHRSFSAKNRHLLIEDVDLFFAFGRWIYSLTFLLKSDIILHYRNTIQGDLL